MYMYLSDSPLDERSPAALHEGPARTSSADPECDAFSGADVDDLAAAPLGELHAVCRTSIMVLVPSNVDPTRAHDLVTGVHVKVEQDRHVFAAALLDRLDVGAEKLVAVQRLSLPVGKPLGRDGRRAAQFPPKLDLLQVVLVHGDAARAAAHLASRRDLSNVILSSQVPLWDVEFYSVFADKTMRVTEGMEFQGDTRAPDR